MLPDRVDQERWITVMDAIEERWKIERHLPTFSVPALVRPGAEPQERRGAARLVLQLLVLPDAERAPLLPAPLPGRPRRIGESPRSSDRDRHPPR